MGLWGIALQSLRDAITGDSPARRGRMAELAGDWTLELDGHVLARLSGWRVPDQFWQAAMATDAFWHETPLTLRSTHSGRAVTIGVHEGPLFAFEQGKRLTDDGTLSLRGL